jgi:penicillin-binding protein 1C
LLHRAKIVSFLKRHRLKLLLVCLLLTAYWFWLPTKLFNSPVSPVLVDSNSELLAAQIASDGQWRFPQSDSIPYKFKQCILNFEDEYFYYHPGFNPVSLFRSLKDNIGAGKIKSGGSTITMQVARMMRNNQSRNIYHKCIELLLAARIELSYKKSSILNVYCSNAPFGGNVVGLHAASWRYFGRSPEKLSWAESAVLAVLPNAPSLIYPGKNQQKLLEKRNRLLKKLLEKNYLDSSSYHLALLEPLPGKPFPIPQQALHLLNRCLAEKHDTTLFHSTINKNIQLHVIDILNKQVQTLASNHIYNACALIAETETGKVIAYVGNSFSADNAHENFVDMINSPRSTGSILKPFLYAFMLNENKILPEALLEDIPTRLGAYAPKNFNLNYDGLVPAHNAIARSLNVPAVKMLQEYSTAKFHRRLKQLGFTTFTKSPDHYGLSLILGGGEATLWDLASAYASMGRALQTYSNIRNKYAQNNYHPLHYLKQPVETVRTSQNTDLLNASSIWFTFSAMTELLRPQDYVGWMHFLKRNRIAWKTGTSYGFRDAWAIGLNPKYTVAVWVGNADGEGRPELTGTAAAAPLMFAIFNLLEQKNWFLKPITDFEKIKVCKQSGYKASEVCEDVEWRDCPHGANRTSKCPFHKFIFLDETGQFQVNSDCYRVGKMKKRAWFVASPTEEYFFKQNSVFYKPMPPYMSGCNDLQNPHQLEIIYPKENFKVYIPVEQSGTKSRCVLKATHKDPSATLFWYLDEEYLGSTQKFHQQSLIPSTGNHVLVITDNFGETRRCKFLVIGKN